MLFLFELSGLFLEVVGRRDGGLFSFESDYAVPDGAIVREFNSKIFTFL
jgi:hypothetical protein